MNLSEYLQGLMAATPTGREVGVSFCSFDGPGPVAYGDHDHVQIPLACDGSNPPVLIFHDHPSGILEPSAEDLESWRAAETEWAAIGDPHTGIVRYFRGPF